MQVPKNSQNHSSLSYLSRRPSDTASAATYFGKRPLRVWNETASPASAVCCLGRSRAGRSCFRAGSVSRQLRQDAGSFGQPLFASVTLCFGLHTRKAGRLYAVGILHAHGLFAPVVTGGIRHTPFRASSLYWQDGVLSAAQTRWCSALASPRHFWSPLARAPRYLALASDQGQLARPADRVAQSKENLSSRSRCSTQQLYRTGNYVAGANSWRRWQGCKQ